MGSVSLISEALLGGCASFAARIAATSHDLDELIAMVQAVDRSTTQLLAQLKMLGTTVSGLQRLLRGDNATISDSAQDKMRSSVAAGLAVIAEIGDHVKRIIAFTTEENTVASSSSRRKRLSNITSTSFRRPSLQLASSSVAAMWSEQGVKDYVRMVATQCQIFSLFNQLTALNNPHFQDSVLETGESLKILYQGSRDAQAVHEMAATRKEAAEAKHSQSAATTQLTLLGKFPPHPAVCHQGGGGGASEISLASTASSNMGHSLGSRLSPGVSSAASSSSTTGATAPANSAQKLRHPSSRSITRIFSGWKNPSSSSSSGGPKQPTADPKLLFSQLCQACRDGDLEWARNQVSEGADVNGIDARCFSPLYYAVLQGNLDIVKLLVANKAQVGGSDGRSSALVFFAVRKNNIPILEYLLKEASAPVTSLCCESRDRGSWRTPLSLAVEQGRLEAVELLLGYGADVHGGDESTTMASNSEILTPLCTAVDKGDEAMVKLLLRFEARINETASATEWGSHLAALHIAAYRGHDAIVSSLLDAGADISLSCRRGSTAGVTALHLATGRCAATLLDRGAKIFARDSSGQFPLSGAVQVRSVESVQALLRRGVPVNAQDGEGDTALHIAGRVFVRDVKAPAGGGTATSSSERLAACIAVAEELIAGGANLGSRKATLKLVRKECGKLLLQHGGAGRPPPPPPPEDIARIELVELMRFVADTVRTQQREARRQQPGTVGSDGPLWLLAQTTLSQLVTR
ncbi:ankyrin repeat-containing domain protein [Podospora didyma]|uniref:Ankyrin repeat-containing domain protein n=1 Tax=Podospora didyma TaxID=330526 RepID=A0AAE0NPW5_9PEZI|nr:ankyrin repeat-containing domain protein [Podospora didyma]